MAFALPERRSRLTPRGRATVVLVTEENVDLLHPLLPAWVPDVKLSAPLYASVVDGRAVAVCGSVRMTPRAHEAGVETVPDFRRQGHATAAVAAWAQRVRDTGIEPLYSTSWRSTASQALAGKLGFRRFDVDLQIA